MNDSPASNNLARSYSRRLHLPATIAGASRGLRPGNTQVQQCQLCDEGKGSFRQTADTASSGAPLTPAQDTVSARSEIDRAIRTVIPENPRTPPVLRVTRVR